MPQSTDIRILINNEAVDLGNLDDLNLKIDYLLESPEDWQNKQSSQAFNLQLPATKKNDAIFNTFWNPQVEDLTANQDFGNIMSASVIVNGVVVLQGYAVLTDAACTDKPEGYQIDIEGGNGSWITNMQNTTLWDCVNPNPHTFDVATVEASWTLFDSDEDHDYVYAPVRYRQPFGDNDDAVNIYALRPSLSIYWMLVRGFRQFGYSLSSQFFNVPDKGRRLVMPWTWGDFFDINSTITDGLQFKAVGPINPKPTGSFAGYATGGGHIYFGGGTAPEPSHDPLNTMWKPWGPNAGYIAGAPPTGTGYVHSLTETSTGGTLFQNFKLDNVTPPNGFDNFGLYSFINATGAMIYTFAPPEPLASFIGNNVTMNFALSLICETFCSVSGTHTTLYIEVTVNGITRPLTEQFTELLATAGQTKGTLLYPTTHNFSVSGINAGDVIQFRLWYDTDSILTNVIQIVTSGYFNSNPADTGASNWQYNPVTQRWANIDGGKTDPSWQSMFSSLELTGLQVELGNNVNLRFYDAFRNYRFLDLLNGLVDAFDLEIQTDPISRIVTIEPSFSSTWNDGAGIVGYFQTDAVLDWNSKIDLNFPQSMQRFKDIERQIDFTFKQDGSDGGQNIYSARNKGLNISKVVKGRINNVGRIDNGLVAALPGASRYMFNSDRFLQGNRQNSNHFFSAVMHYNHTPWKALTTANIAPQLICIIPENINDSSASAVTQTFEPKLAFYKGVGTYTDNGAWVWIGDPAHPNASPIRDLPLMFAVNYGINGEYDPVLSYSDQYINGVVVDGLMKTFFLRRLAIMRNGQLYSPNLRLNLNDVCNWEHRQTIKLYTSLYALISINGYNPASDGSNQVKLWRIVNAEQVDVDNSYPSRNTIITNPPVLTNPYDLKYAPLLLFITDLPR